ncbi:MAG: hypothetical protein ACM359_18865 [Bacillota bacterium]
MMKRFRYSVSASLQLFCDAPNSPYRTLRTRKVNPRGAVFVSPSQLPVGYAGIARLPLPNGTLADIYCTVSRCRLLAPNHYVGTLCFSRDQYAFSEYAFPASSPQRLAA